MAAATRHRHDRELIRQVTARLVAQFPELAPEEIEQRLDGRYADGPRDPIRSQPADRPREQRPAPARHRA